MGKMEFGKKQSMADKVKVASRDKSGKAKDKPLPPKAKVSVKGTNPFKKKLAIGVKIPIQKGK